MSGSGAPEARPLAPGTLMPWRLLVTLASGTFLITASAVALFPFLLDIARDLGTTLGAMANLIGLMSVSWGVVSVSAGAASDRLGRRPVLVAAVLTLGVARLGLALSDGYVAAGLWQLLAGVGGGGFMGTVFATVSDRVPIAQRGRALGWVITGQSLSLVFGVPLVTLLGAYGGWRVAVGIHASTALVAAGAIWLAVGGGVAVRAAPGHVPTRLRGVVGLRTVALLVANTMERTCFAAIAVYLAAFLQTTYGVGMHALALALALVALGNLAGNLMGGWLADRVGERPLVSATAAVVTGAFGLPLMLWHPGVAASVALGFGYSLANAAGRPALMATLSEVPAEVRGAVLGLNVTMSSVGWLAASGAGGWLVARHGFEGLGVMTGAVALAGALCALVAWKAPRRGA